MKKISISFILWVLGLVFMCCGTSSRTQLSFVDKERFGKLINERSFEIRSDFAFPMATNSMNSLSNAGLFPPGSAGNAINLIGNTNYLRIKGDSVIAYLPYFGERQMGGGYNNSGIGIQFEGIPEKMEISENEEKQRYDVRFKMKKNAETFNVNLILFPNQTSTINVNSSQRFPIRYQGTFKAISDE